jgi:hypothetical protein
MSACTEWKGEVFDSAMRDEFAVAATVISNEAGLDRGAKARRLESHLKGCAECSALFADLRARTARVDAALPKLADAGEVSEGFEARVFGRIAARQMESRKMWWSGWGMRLATAGVVCAVVAALVMWPQMKKLWRVREAPTISISKWRSPTESLLRTPGQELLERGPKVGDVYLPLDTGSDRVNK